MTRQYYKYTFVCNDTYSCDALIEYTALEYKDVNFTLTCVCGSPTTFISQEPMLHSLRPRYKQMSCYKCAIELAVPIQDESDRFYCYTCAMDKLAYLP